MRDKNEAEASILSRQDKDGVAAVPNRKAFTAQISTDQAARILRISRGAVLRLIKSGKLEARVIGRSGRYRIWVSSVMDYAEKRKASGGPASG